MSRALEIAAFCACVAVTLACMEAAATLRDARLATPATQKQLTQLLTDADRTTIIVAGTATNIEKETRQWKDQSLAQSRAATNAVSQLNSDLQELGTLLATADSTLTKQDASLTSLEQQAGGLIEATRPTLLDLQMSADALAKEAPPILENVQETTGQTAQIARSTAGTSANIEASTADIRMFVHRETSPVTGTWNVIKGFLREFAGPAAQVATAIK